METYAKTDGFTENETTETLDERRKGMEETFGPVLSSYSRADAIADGCLVNVTDNAKRDGFRFPVAMTRAAWSETVEAGGSWHIEGGNETLSLPGGQDVKGRLHDVFWMLHCAIKRSPGGDRVDFSVLVDTHGNGRRKTVALCSLCGPGDDMEPVITIMLPNED